MTDLKIWRKQELYKGCFDTDPLAGWVSTSDAGWGFSLAGLYQGVPRLFPYTAFLANRASLDALRADPVHLHSPADKIFPASYSGFLRNSYLARSLPALSSAVGLVSVSAFGNNNNFNLTGMKPNGWPTTRPNANSYGDRWQHSDIHNVAYYYTYMAFRDIVTKGQLK